MTPGEESDPVVARVREAREAVAKACAYDLEKMAELFKSMQADHPQRVRSARHSRGTPVQGT